MNLDEFLSQAGDHGPGVGIHPVASSPVVAPAGIELRTIDGAHTKTLDALFEAFAATRHFPPWFGAPRMRLMVSCVTGTTWLTLRPEGRLPPAT